MKRVLIAAVVSCEAAFSPLPADVSSDGETLPGQGVERLADGEINPTCAWLWQKKPIRVEFDLGDSPHITSVDLVLCQPLEHDFLWGQGETEITPAE